MRVGMFGGAFDPPHNAHVALAAAALDQLALDVLHVVPTGHAWHKSRTLSPAMDRLAMARLAFAGLPRVVVDDRETLRDGPTYTLDTLKALQAENPQATLYLFMGADQFTAFRQWHHWEDILRIAIICIADRGESALASSQLPADFAPGGIWQGRIAFLTLPLMDLSATRIRHTAASGGETGALVPEAVARYISQHQLYRIA